MITQTRAWHKSLSHSLGHWLGKQGGRYACPLWAEKDAYTLGYLKARGIIRPQESEAE